VKKFPLIGGARFRVVYRESEERRSSSRLSSPSPSFAPSHFLDRDGKKERNHQDRLPPSYTRDVSSVVEKSTIARRSL